MSDLISREALITTMKTLCDESKPLDVLICNVSVAAIKKAPTVDAEPIRHGHWINDDFTAKFGNPYRCSRCKEESNDTDFYCRYCGAKMDDECSRGERRED